MPTPHPFAQVDVFSREPYRGNPVAVILDADDIDEGEMQRIARWTNLSETTFVLTPTDASADYRVRIFTPGGELPFAGHPTLGSARAWLDRGGKPHIPGTIVQECAAGLIELRHEGDSLSFAAPPVIRSGDLEESYVVEIAKAFGIDRERIIAHQWVDNGPGWAVVRLASSDEVLALEPDFSRLPDAKVGAIGATPDESPHAFEIRAFVPGVGVLEDPVTGSLNASTAQWLIGQGEAPERYTVAQGTRLGRAGEVEITSESGTVWVGGATTVCFRGTAEV